MPTEQELAMPEPRELVLLTEATRTLAQATTIDEVKDLRDKATAVKAYIQKAQLGQQLLIDAAVFRLRAERRLGEMLAALELANAAPGNQYTNHQSQSATPDRSTLLRDLGISKKDSSRSQRIAGLDEDVFERYLAGSTAAGRQPTFAGLLRLQKKEPIHVESGKPTSVLPNTGPKLIADMAASNRLFTTIYAAPPWPLLAFDQKEAVFSIADLQAEPVSRVCENDSHLHIRTDIVHLSHAMQLMHGWGFRYRSCLVCLRPEMEDGEFWQHANQFLLLGTRGRLPFSDLNQPSWIECDWIDDGSRPDGIHSLIEVVSPPSYLQLFADDPPPNTSWTNCPLPKQPHQAQR